jgi:hypothetical protein
MPWNFNGSITALAGQAQSSGASGGNSTAKQNLTVLSLNDGAASGGGLSDATLSSAVLVVDLLVVTPCSAFSRLRLPPPPAAATPAPKSPLRFRKTTRSQGGNNNADAVAIAPLPLRFPYVSVQPWLSWTGGGGNGFANGV